MIKLPLPVVRFISFLILIVWLVYGVEYFLGLEIIGLSDAISWQVLATISMAPAIIVVLFGPTPEEMRAHNHARGKVSKLPIHWRRYGWIFHSVFFVIALFVLPGSPEIGIALLIVNVIFFITFLKNDDELAPLWPKYQWLLHGAVVLLSVVVALWLEVILGIVFVAIYIISLYVLKREGPH